MSNTTPPDSPCTTSTAVHCCSFSKYVACLGRATAWQCKSGLAHEAEGYIVGDGGHGLRLPAGNSGKHSTCLDTHRYISVHIDARWVGAHMYVCRSCRPWLFIGGGRWSMGRGCRGDLSRPARPGGLLGAGFTCGAQHLRDRLCSTYRPHRRACGHFLPPKRP